MIGLDTFAKHFKVKLPESIRKDVASFIEQMVDNPPDTKHMFKAMGIGAINAGDLIEQIRQTFNLQEIES